MMSGDSCQPGRTSSGLSDAPRSPASVSESGQPAGDAQHSGVEEPPDSGCEAAVEGQEKLPLSLNDGEDAAVAEVCARQDAGVEEPSGSEPTPSPGESQSLDSLESFSNLNSCPSSEFNSEGADEKAPIGALLGDEDETAAGFSVSKERFPGQSVYHIKWIQWKEENTPIVTQNENGPCPLLAIMNVLLLAWKKRFLSKFKFSASNPPIPF